MKKSRVLVAVAAASLALGLSACTSAAPGVGPVVTPTVVNAEDINGGIVTVSVDGTVVINTGAEAIDSYSADIADPSIASFVQGKTDAGAEFNPGLDPLKVGETEITLTGPGDDIVFTLAVTE